jgi:outer membrane protein OmpA-like peptidoglycan-associated protein
MRRHAGFAARPAVPGDPPESSPRGADRSESAAPRQAVWMRLLAAGIAFGIVLLAGCERPDSVQWGHRGSSMIQLFTPSGVRALADINAIPEPEPDDPYDPTFPMATEIHENVQVLTDLNALELARLMNAMVTWIAPEEGCAYCHNPENLADDSKYTKHVSRQMLKMTRDINANWTSHVAETGVTCWTCHRGQPVPTDTWFTAPEPKRPSAHTTGAKAGQNTAGIRNNGNTSLPFDPLTAFLTDDTEIGVQGSQALPHGNRQSTKQTEWTYALMMYMSNSLGVNCTYCHNTRAMGEWDQSTPQRVTAWHGIRMVRDMNQEHLNPLLPLYPEHRLGPTGDAPKAACGTCHKGTYKPLYGESMLADYPALQGVLPGRFSPDPTEGGLIRISTAPEGATIATMEERTRMAEAMLAAAAGGPATVAATADGEAPVAAEMQDPAEDATAAAADADSVAEAETEPSEPTIEAVQKAHSKAMDRAERRLRALHARLDQERTALNQQLVVVRRQRDQAQAELGPGDAERVQAALSGSAGGMSGQSAVQLMAQPAGGGASADDMTVGELDRALGAVLGLVEKLGAVRAQLDAAATPGASLPAAAPLPALNGSNSVPAPSAPGDTGNGVQPEATVAPMPTAMVEAAATDFGQPTSQAPGIRQTLIAADAERQIDDLEARLRQQIAAMEQQLAAVRAERDAAVQALTDAAAGPEDGPEDGTDAGTDVGARAEYARALDAEEATLVAMNDGLEQQTQALSEQLAAVRAQRDEQRDALAAAEAKLAAMGARLAQQTHALNQQLGVVRTQRDGAEAEMLVRVPGSEHRKALAAAEVQLDAMGARLAQQTHALNQQLAVVRSQRDGVAQEVLARVPGDEHRKALAAAEVELAAMGARLAQQTQALNQQLAVVRSQRDGAEQEVLARVPGNAHRKALATAESGLAAMGARLEQQTHALGQQLALVRNQRNAAEEALLASIPAKEHIAAIAALETRITAMQARLDQQTHALEQQLVVVRGQRDGTAEEARAQLAALEAAHADTVSGMQQRIAAAETRLRQERQALQQQLVVVRGQRDSATADTETQDPGSADGAAEVVTLRQAEQAAAPPTSAEGSATPAQALAEGAAAVGGEVTDTGIRVNLGGDRLSFASGSATLPAGELPDLDRTAELLASRPELTARIEGHTDSVGSAALNQSLSQQRAEAVRAALVARGIDPARLTAVGIGPDRPIADNATPQGRSQNRRVEILLSSREQVATQEDRDG